MHNIIDLQDSDVAMNEGAAHHSGVSLFACHGGGKDSSWSWWSCD
jgi:hypothetical protein